LKPEANHPRKGSYADARKIGEVDSNGCLSDGTQVVYDVDFKRLKEDSIKYNNMLKEHQRKKLTSSLSYVEPSLKLSKYGIFDGVYGYLEAPTIDMKLPIYLGTARDHLNYGAAHLTYTSLPIGGKDTTGGNRTSPIPVTRKSVAIIVRTRRTFLLFIRLYLLFGIIINML